jgi:hypothetical protein
MVSSPVLEFTLPTDPDISDVYVIVPPTFAGVVVDVNWIVLEVVVLLICTGVMGVVTASFVYASMVVPYACERITPLFKLVLLYTMVAAELLI